MTRVLGATAAARVLLLTLLLLVLAPALAVVQRVVAMPVPVPTDDGGTACAGVSERCCWGNACAGAAVG